MTKRKISSEKFIQGMTKWFQRLGYRVGADDSGLPSKTEDWIVHKAADELVKALGFRAGATGFKEVTAKEALNAVSGFVETADVLGWSIERTPILMPVFWSDDSTPGDERQLLQACFVRAQSMNALSKTKYGGYICIFPLLVYLDEKRYEQSLGSLKVQDAARSWIGKVEMVAGLVSVQGQRVGWPEQVFSRRMEDYAKSIRGRPE